MIALPGRVGAVAALLFGGTPLPGGSPPPRAADAVVVADPVARWRPYSRAAAQRCGVPLDWIERVMRAESGGRAMRDGRPVTSPAGAMGLMQIMPATWAMLRARLGLGTDPYDPRDNILAGACYLRGLHARFGYPGLFGAYHAGPGRYAAWQAGRSTLPQATRRYLAQLGGRAAASAALPQAPLRRAALFAVRRDAAPGEAALSVQSLPPGLLFVALSTAPGEAAADGRTARSAAGPAPR